MLVLEILTAIMFCSVTLTNLKSSSLYHITVYAENGVSNISGAFASAYVTVNTEASGMSTRHHSELSC